jgi:hypothetical protein
MEKQNGLSPKIIQQVRERDNYTCRLCQKDLKDTPAKLDTHHIIPKKLGGKDEINNLLTLCHSCHITNEFAIKRLKPRYGEIKCHHCESENVIKSGSSAYSGGLKQRWYCKSCWRYFVP